MIHYRIRRARLLRGLTLDAVAQRVGDITKQGLSKFEKGDATPNSTRLIQLAALEFRKLARMPQKRQHQVGEQMRDHLERYISLERCFELDDQDGFDGACAATADERYVLIALNGDRPGERLRFTAAHELGHWVMALPEDMPEKDKEACCNRFADAGYQGMNMQFSAKGWRTSEPEPLRPEQPRRFKSLVYRALAEDLISRPRAAELMQCSVAELDPDLRRLQHHPLSHANTATSHKSN